MTYVTRTATMEAERRATLVGIPTEAVLPYVEAELAKKPVKVSYEVLNSQELVEIVQFPEAEWVTFNINHAFVRNVMLGDSTTKEQRSGIEVMLLVIHGVGTDMSDEARRKFYIEHAHTLSEYMARVTETMFAVDKDGYNMFGMSER